MQCFLASAPSVPLDCCSTVPLQVLLNAEAGHLLRTKAATSNEGGVAAGFAVIDSPLLMD